MPESSPTPARTPLWRSPLAARALAALLCTCAVVFAVTSSAIGSTKTTTLTAWVVKDDIPSPVLAKITSQFEQSHPGVKVKIVPFSFSDLQVKGKLALAGPHPPDITQVSIPPQVIGQLVRGGKLLNLDSASAKYGWAKRYPASVLAYQRYDKAGTPYKGDLYGLPQYIAPVGVFYNKKKLAQLGLQIPKTFAQFQHDLVVAKNANQTPMLLGELDKWPAIHLYGLIQNQYLRKSVLRKFVFTTSGNFNYPGSVTAAKIFQQWAENGYLQSDFNGTSYDDAGKSFAQGKAVFYPTGSWLTAQLRADMGNNVGFFLMPPRQLGGSLEVTSSPNQPWVVPTKSPNRDLAVEYLDSISSARAGGIYAKAGLIPAMEIPKLPNVTGLGRDVLVAGQTILRQDATIPYLDVATSTMYDTITTALQELLAKQISPADFVSRVEKDYDKSRHK